MTSFDLAIAGFLLTAVPSWTGERGFAGWPLILLAAIWALGRIVAATSSLWPPPAVAGLDLSFLPVLAALLLPPLLRPRNRNTPLLAMLTALWITDFAFHWGLLHDDPGLARHALFIGIDIVLVLVTVIGSRIIPAFTSAALKQRGISSPLHVWRAATPLAVGAMLAVAAIDLWRPESKAAGTTFAAFHLHALTIGAASTLILAVMTRASLGHTGRPLVVSRMTTCAYGLLTAAAAVRVFGPAILSVPYTAVVWLAAALWTGAFLLFLTVYAPMLLGPRIDAKPG